MSSLKHISQVVLVVVAAVVSFLGAMQWRRAQTASAPPIVELVAKEHRPVSIENDSKTSTKSGIAGFALALPDRARAVPQSGGDAFAMLSWLAPAPVARPAAPAPPPAPVIPVAPPLPFTFMGLIKQGTSRPEAFLAKGNALLVVATGDVIDDNTYRVDSLGAQQIQLTYLPLNTQQTLNFPETTK